MERPAGLAAYRAWKVFGRHLLNRAAIEQVMRWCRDWIDGDKNKPRPEPGEQGRVPTVEDILQGPVPAHGISHHPHIISDVLPGPLPPPSTVTGLFPSPLPAPSSTPDAFKEPSLAPVLPCVSTTVPPRVPPTVVNYAHLRRWGAAGCAVVAGALLYLTYRRRRPQESAATIRADTTKPDTTKSDATEPAPDATEPDPDAADESARITARAVIVLLFFSALSYLGPEGAYA